MERRKRVPAQRQREARSDRSIITGQSVVGVELMP